MSNANSGDVITAEANQETRCLNWPDMADVNSADSNQSTSFTSEEVVREIKTVTDLLPK